MPFSKLITRVNSALKASASLPQTDNTALCNQLNSKNSAVINARVPLTSARIARNQLLYNELTSLVDISVDVKLYMKSVFGATSPLYKAISGLSLVKR